MRRLSVRVVLAGALLLAPLGVAVNQNAASAASRAGLASTAQSPASVSASSPASMTGDASTALSDGSDPEAVASAQAVAQQHPVVVAAETTATRQVAAEPDGTFSEELATEPVRVRRDGSWTPIDPTLQTGADGWVAPKAVPGQLRLSGGGPAGSVVADYQADGVGYQLHSPWALPRPVLAGATATYSDVLPGVDLVVRAGSTGFSHNWVIKTRQAAESSQVEDLRLPVTLTGVSARADHSGTAYVDGRGALRLWTPAPLMWDAAGLVASTGATPSSREAAVTGPVAGDGVAPVATETGEQTLEMTPSEDMLTDPDTVFPVVIDPTVQPASASRNAWTAVWSIYPYKSFWKTSHSMGAGYEGFSQDKVVRSYFRFPTSQFAGKRMLQAKMTLTQIWDASCDARVTQMYRTGAITSNTTWHHQPSRFGLQGTNSKTTGCQGGDGSVGFNALPGMKTAASDHLSSVTFMLRAKNESDRLAWKQFDHNAKLDLHYVSRPGAPTGVRFQDPTTGDWHSCVTDEADAPYISATSVRLQERVHDPDSDAFLYGQFSRGGLSGLVSARHSDGELASVTWSGLSDGWHSFRGWTLAKWTLYGGGSWHVAISPPTWCHFRVDTTAPAKPAVQVSPSFAECADPTDPDSCPKQGVVGHPGQVGISDSSSDVDHYEITQTSSALDRTNPTTKTWTVAATGSTQTVQITPQALFTQLQVTAVDKADNSRSSTEVDFVVNPVTAAGQWEFDGNDSTSLAYSNAGVAPGARGRIGNGLELDGTGYASATVADASSAQDFTVAGWVRVDGADEQTVFSAPGSSGAALSVGYDPDARAWTLSRTASDGGAATAAHTAAVALRHVWTHLAATYDASAQQTRLYVNGVPEATLSGALWDNGGAWRFGCGQLGAAPAHCMTGSLDQLRVYDGLIDTSGITTLADPLDAEDNPANRAVSHWEFSDLSDSLGNVGLQASTAPTLVPAEGFDGLDSALQLPGENSPQVQAPRPAVDATGSFTIAAWAYLDGGQGAPKTQVITQQHGTDGTVWTLAYRATTDGGQWVFARQDADSATGDDQEAVQDTAGAADDWTYLTGVYDRRAGTLRLYVNSVSATDDQGEMKPPTAYASPWQGNGVISFGAGALSDPADPGGTRTLTGEISDVQAWVGRLGPDQVPAACDATSLKELC